MAVFDIKSWLASLKTEFNIPDEKIPTQEIEGYGLRQDKFTQKMQEYDRKESDLNSKFQALEPFEKFLRTLENENGWGPREQWTADQVNFARQNESNANRQPAGMTQEAVQQLVANSVKTALDAQNAHWGQQLENTQRGAALLIDFIPEARDEWRETYGGKYGISQKFPKPEFEQFISPGDPANGVQPGKGYGVPLQAAWEMFKSPYEAKRVEATWEEKLKTTADEAYRRGASQNSGSLEPFADVTMSAAVLADRQNVLPKDQQRAEPSEAEKRDHFTSAYHRSLQGGGSAVSTSTPVPVPAAAVAAK